MQSQAKNAGPTSPGAPRSATPPDRIPPGRRLRAGFACLVLLPGLLLGAPTNTFPDAPTAHPVRSEVAYHAAQTAAAATNSVANLWNLGRTAFDLAESLRLSKPKAKVAEAGITACRTAIALEPASAPAHYYLALCLGQLAQTKTLGALRLVREIQSELERARVLDATFDHAGADRGLGLLYLEAPGWPTSIGDRPLARRHLEKAVLLAPDYPDNHLGLLEALVRAKDAPAAAAALTALEAAWPRAQGLLTGPDWSEAWADWESRRQTLKTRVSRLNGRK